MQSISASNKMYINSDFYTDKLSYNVQILHRICDYIKNLLREVDQVMAAHVYTVTVLT